MAKGIRTPPAPKAQAAPPPAAIRALQAAIQAHRAGRLAEAIGLYRQAVKAAPGMAPAHYNLGIALRAAGQARASEQALAAAVKADPSHARAHAALGDLAESRGQGAQAFRHRLAAYRAEQGDPSVLGNLVRAFGAMRFTQADPRLEDLACTLLRRNDVEGQRLAGAALSLLELRPPIRAALAGEDFGALPSETPPLLLAVLERTIVAEPRWETMLTRLRAELAAGFSLLDAPAAPLVQALAAQMLATDYAYAADGEGEAALAVPEGSELTPAHAILAMYRPLRFVAEKLSGPPDWEGFLDLHLARPAEERQAGEAVPALTPIEDRVSQAVRDQYTALPYPRWQATRAIVPKPRRDVLAAIAPAAARQMPSDPSPLRVLVAGCGTGKHAVDVATRFAGADVLAVDLSRPSLGYASAQAARMGIGNVRFGEADILALAGIGERFDHIEAMGVLHHLGEPLAGWRVLRGLLTEAGTMRIGLYSRRGRTAIKAAQAIAAGFGHDPEGLRALRRAIHALPEDHPAAPVRRELDFYTLSGVRDALAHAQEHDYTLPEIGAMLETLGLRFLGFEFAAGHGPSLYRQAYPEDSAMADLERWDSLEEVHPDLFHHMYQFWCTPA